MLIQTKRIYVRPFTEKDLEDFYLVNGDAEIMRYIREPKSKEESAQFLKEVVKNYILLPGLGRWGIIEKTSDQVIGMFSLLPLEHTKDIHIGYALLKTYWGKGYASEIVKAGLIYTYEILKLTSVAAITHPDNIVSQKILIKNNFRYEGVLKEGGKGELLYRHKPGKDY